MSDCESQLEQLHTALGYKPLSRTWAKVEILLGLFVAGLGLLVGVWTVSRDIQFDFALGGLILFVLGGYLALAGSRSHQYQSSNELAAYLVREIHQLKDKAS